tara:strand:- start:29730 stop:30965 length:1236 start_codon:yes stop_codon:yes gene_type:complete
MWGHRKALAGGWNLLKTLNLEEDDLSAADDVAKLRVMDNFAAGGANKDIRAGWSGAALDRGHDVKTAEIMYAGNPDKEYDVDLGYMPDLAGDILQYDLDDYLSLFGGKTPDVFFSSPPCEGNSVAAFGSKPWEDWEGQDKKKKDFNRARNAGDAEFFMQPGVGPTATNAKSQVGRELLLHQLGMIDQLQDYRLNNEGLDADDPMYWWLENPTGMMRFQPELGARNLAQPLKDFKGGNVKQRRGQQTPWPSVTHASYSGPFAELLGFERNDIPGHPALPSRKPTDLWTNATNIWQPRPHTAIGLAADAPELTTSLEELRARLGNRIKEVPTAPKRPGHAGKYHAWAPRGARSGTQGIGDYKMPGGLTMPKYQMRSLIPYGLGLDAIMAVERAKAGMPGLYPSLGSGAQQSLF